MKYLLIIAIFLGGCSTAEEAKKFVKMCENEAFGGKKNAMISEIHFSMNSIGVQSVTAVCTEKQNVSN